MLLAKGLYRNWVRQEFYNNIQVMMNANHWGAGV